MEWISIEKELPEYYKPLVIYDGERIRFGWSRVSDGDEDYYVSGETNLIIEKITHWILIPVTQPPNKP